MNQNKRVGAENGVQGAFLSLLEMLASTEDKTLVESTLEDIDLSNYIDLILERLPKFANVAFFAYRKHEDVFTLGQRIKYFHFLQKHQPKKLDCFMFEMYCFPETKELVPLVYAALVESDILAVGKEKPTVTKSESGITLEEVV